MARTRTALELIDDARKAADQETIGSNVPLCSKSEVLEYLNQGIAEFQDFLIINNAASYFNTTTTFSTVPGQAVPDTYPLPADFYKLTNVYWNANTGLGLTRMTELSPNDDEYQITGTGWDYLSRVRYEVLIGNIRFVPTPSGVHVVTLKYIKAPARLAADSDTVDGYAGWERYFICYAASMMARKEKDMELVGALEGEMSKMGKRILVMARRNIGEPKRVQDVRNRRVGVYGRRI